MSRGLNDNHLTVAGERPELLRFMKETEEQTQAAQHGKGDGQRWVAGIIGGAPTSTVDKGEAVRYRFFPKLSSGQDIRRESERFPTLRFFHTEHLGTKTTAAEDAELMKPVDEPVDESEDHADVREALGRFGKAYHHAAYQDGTIYVFDSTDADDAAWAPEDFAEIPGKAETDARCRPGNPKPMEETEGAREYAGMIRNLFEKTTNERLEKTPYFPVVEASFEMANDFVEKGYPRDVIENLKFFVRELTDIIESIESELVTA